MNEVQTLSSDIHVITAEINAYQRVAGEAIFEIGRRIHKVHVEKLSESRGGWTAWLREIDLDKGTAHRFMSVYTELGDKVGTYQRLGLRALSEIATMPEEQRDLEHEIPSTGEVKKVEEMTVRELREVKAELKKAQESVQQAEQRAIDAKRSEEILTRQNEQLSEQLASATKPEIVEVEKEVDRLRKRTYIVSLLIYVLLDMKFIILP